MNDKIWDLFFDNWQKLLYPEERLTMELSLPLSKMELIALLLIWRNDEMIMTQLADSIDIPMSTATGIVNRLVKKGCVERLIDETNRRLVNVKLTQEGKNTAESIKQALMKYWNLFTAILTDEENEMLYKLLSRFITSLQEGNFESKGGKKTIQK